MLNVQFVNSGWGTDHGIKAVELVEVTVSDDGAPIAMVKSPFSFGNVYTAQFKASGWVVDLD